MIYTGKICPNPTDSPLRGTPNNTDSDDVRRVQRANSSPRNGGYLSEGTPSEALARPGQRKSPINLQGKPAKRAWRTSNH